MPPYVPAAAVEENWDDEPADDEAEVRRVARQLAARNMVSVAFFDKHCKCTKLISRVGFFDNGSPTSFVRRSTVPFEVTDKTIMTNYRGMGNKNLSTHGFVKCKIVFEGREYLHKFLILPDAEAVVPFLIGRDLMRKMHIHLCQLKQTYNVTDLLKFKNEKRK